MNNNTAVTYLLNLALQHNIGVEFMDLSPSTPPATNVSQRLIAMNANWHNRDDIPMQLAHEIGHIFNKDDERSCLYFSPTKNGIEGKANQTAISLLLKPYLESKEKEDVSSADFITTFHLPIALEDMVITQIADFYKK